MLFLFSGCPLPNIANTEPIEDPPAIITEGTIIDIECSPGYLMRGSLEQNFTLVCLENGLYFDSANATETMPACLKGWSMHNIINRLFHHKLEKHNKIFYFAPQ